MNHFVTAVFKKVTQNIKINILFKKQIIFCLHYLINCREVTGNDIKQMKINMQQENPAGPEQEMLRFMVSALNSVVCLKILYFYSPVAACVYRAENTALRNLEHNVK